MGSTWVRRSAAGLATVFTLSLGYLVLGNWWLRRSLERSAEAAGCELDYASAYTLYPGQFRLEGVEVMDCYGGQLSLQAHSASGRLSIVSLVRDAFEIEHLSVDAHAGRWGRVSWEGALRIDGYELKGAPELAFEELRMELADGVVRGARTEDLRVRELEARASATAGVEEHVDVAIFANEVRLSRGDDETFPWLEGLEIELHPGNEAGRWLDIRVEEATLDVRGHRVVTGVMAALHVPAIESGAIVVDGGMLELPGMSVAEQPLHAQAHIDEARLSLSGSNRLRGTFVVAGSDAGLLLDLLRASESLRLTLSLIEGQPFLMAGLIDRSEDGTLLAQTELESEQITARGSMRLRPSPAQGRFQVTYGSLRFGICAGPNGSDLLLEATPWSTNTARADGASKACRHIFDPGRTFAAPGSS